MSERLLLCSDLDRTLLPNGLQPESPQARPLLRSLAVRPELILAYVSGRHLALIEQAIAEYGLPRPQFAVGDVGTSIYRSVGGEWRLWDQWSQHIATDWAGHPAGDLARLFADIEIIALQEPEKQNRFKLSYYADPTHDHAALLADMHRRLRDRGVRASLVWSVDETTPVGLLDVLPASATKLGAVRFLMAELGIDETRTLFAGDSGNDLPVLTSGIPAVLVANATPEVRGAAESAAQAAGHADRLYVARGGFLGMNGNYAAGVLEGLAHFHPQWADRLATVR
ncbi:MAG: HAD-IIB family hydrolase [Burkholderiaceae bacterium]|nr:HAD-IIB family hydrolase [Burkholderiaceae bacterium]